MTTTPPDTSPQAAIEIAVDAHVHIHEPGLELAVVEQAARNFAAFCPVASRTGVLMLAETGADDAFERLRVHALSQAREGRGGITAESTSLWFSTLGWRILVVAGRQVVTAERLEVLALATSARFPDGLPLEELLPLLAREDAIAVLPWGCGKWLGQRGRLVERAIASARPTPLFLGDNSGRPRPWRVPLLQTAAARRLRVLSGTDPLPLDHEWRRVGRFGCVASTHVSRDTPVLDLKAALRDPDRPLRPYGRLESSGRFVRNQLLLRVRGLRLRADPRGAHDAP